MLIGGIILIGVSHFGQLPTYWDLPKGEEWARSYITGGNRQGNRYWGEFKVRPHQQNIKMIGHFQPPPGGQHAQATVVVSGSGATWNHIVVTDNQFTDEWQGLYGSLSVTENFNPSAPTNPPSTPPYHSPLRVRRETRLHRTSFAGTGTQYTITQNDADDDLDEVELTVAAGRVSVYYADNYFASIVDVAAQAAGAPQNLWVLTDANGQPGFHY